jgi:hypothetical protein
MVEVVVALVRPQEEGVKMPAQVKHIQFLMVLLQCIMLVVEVVVDTDHQVLLVVQEDKVEVVMVDNQDKIMHNLDKQIQVVVEVEEWKTLVRAMVVVVVKV